jgi:serine/threonine-protein kinase
MKIERLGPYRIVRELGRGGMGTVYQGVDLDTGEPAAVKLLSAALGREEDFRSRFEAEIEALRKLNHPNIVRLFGFGEQDGLLFYAMELVDGKSLEDELGSGRSFDWREVAQIGVETCHALRHAHNRGVIHRDIKPGNLLLGSNGHVKLSDFGIARLFGNVRMTSAGSVLGTAEFMAPEQAEGKPVDPRADLYSLGAVLYVLLARRPLFRAKSFGEMLHKQRFEEPEPVGRYAADCPAELEQIVMQLLEKEPGRRIPTPDLLGRRLAAMQHALSRNLGELPATRLLDRAPDEPPPPVSTPSPPEEPPETKAASAFEVLGQPEGSGPEPQEAEKPPSERPKSRFIPVKEQELDAPAAKSRAAYAALFSPQTWALVAALVAIGWGAWYFLRPPSADALFNRITARYDGTGASLVSSESDIEEFLKFYPDDSRADQLHEYQKTIALDPLERQIEHRAANLSGGAELLPVERAYLEAIRYARLAPEQGIARLQALIDLYGHEADDAEPTARCLELARLRLKELREQVDRAAPDVQALLKERLAEADRLRATDPARARAIYRAIIELYADKPWAAAAVRHARNALGRDASGVVSPP